MNLRRLLSPFSLLYTLGQRMDRARKLRSQHTSALPVISIGNLSVGGSGKTPLVLHLVEQLQKEFPVLVLSRGHGRADMANRLWTPGHPIDPALIGDEPALIARMLVRGALGVARNRGRYLHDLESRFPGHVVLLDDGFQHYALARDLDIVILDDRTVAHPQLLPAGDLREPLSALRRAGVILASSVAAQNLAHAWNVSDAPVMRMHQEVVDITGWTDASQPYQGMPAVAVSGIARPERFFDALRQLDANIVAMLKYPDHHRYSGTDVARIRADMKQHGAVAIVTTAKDAVKLAPLVGAAVPMYVARLRVVLEHEEQLLDIVRKVIERKILNTEERKQQ